MSKTDVKMLGWLVALSLAATLCAFTAGCDTSLRSEQFPPRVPTVAAELLAAHNAARLRHGRYGMGASERLDAEAQAWADRMARTGTFRHSGRGAENIAWGYPSVASVMDGWLGSPGHRANILGSYTAFGAGVARAANGSLYWCARFE